MLSELQILAATRCGRVPDRDDILVIAERLAMAYGMVEARTAADEMVAAWNRSISPDAEEAARLWQDIRKAIDAMDACIGSA